MDYDQHMHEGDMDIEAYKRWLTDCFEEEETIELRVGESCRINDDHVAKLPKPDGPSNPIFRYNDRFKLMYKRVSETEYMWLDSEGNQGTDPGPITFYAKHWVKV